ncbi:MAG TPA: hypothetical protein PKC55_17950 [Dysgonomonas sp.]|uniref:hypothetical protein n=1 Tax=Dysgonomonas sp. TaxID=1891233 RepID=UPI0028054675|nr:hypothetical protein [Dysgonomonas sp.]HML66713.1 hypothetical protein [Dysgonomonas sp.]
MDSNFRYGVFRVGGGTLCLLSSISSDMANNKADYQIDILYSFSTSPYFIDRIIHPLKSVNMYYTEPYRKIEFTAKYQQQERVYQLFVTALKAIKPIIARYDGKMVNVKLIKSAKEVIKDVFVSLSGNTINISVDSLTRMYKSENTSGNGNIDRSNYGFTISTDDNKRLDSAKTIETISEEINYLISEITAILNDISFKYDKEVEEYKKLKQAIKDYEQRFSNRLRRYIRID